MIESMHEVMLRIREIRQRFYPVRTVPQSPQPQGGGFSDQLEHAVRSNFSSELPVNEYSPSAADNDAMRRGAISDIVRDYAARNHVPPALVNAVIEVESSFNPRAVSPRGAMGLMQLMPGVAASLGVEDPFEPEENIRGGVALLRRLLDKYGNDYSRALAAYNAGEAAVDRSGGIPDIPETRNYVNRVMRAYVRNSE
jgi:soluble lytic murein transglycosylase-like protein